MKAYTDLGQSKKLAEILPLESADMYWWYSDKRYYIEAMDDGDFNEEEGHIRAWSLAALLAILPNEILTDERFECHYQIDIRKYDGGDKTTLYQIAYGNNRGFSGSWHDMINTGEKESLIDACYDMILNLNKSKLL
jgi:hypothetical protein